MQHSMEAISTGTIQSLSGYSESSRTGSSRSGASTDKERDFDLTKDNAASPVDLECQIQAERITKILDEAVYKTKLAVCLPNLVQEYTTLNAVLSSEHKEDLMFIFEQYDNPLFSASLLNIAAVEDIKGGDFSLKNRLNSELGHLMYILNSYPELEPKVEEMISEMKKEYLQQSVQQKQKLSVIEYLMILEQFRELMVVQMNTTAAEELAAKLHTRKLESSNAKLIGKIQEYTTSLKDEQANFEETMKNKAEIISKLENELAFLNHEANIKLKKQILDSDRQMVLASRAHAVKAEMLKEEEAEARETYEKQLKQHLIDEKNQRARRFKVETQLTSWLQKYDSEMSDKQIELDEFSTKYDEELEKCDILKEKLEEQDKEYIPLMEEREAEYHQEMTEKMQKFLIEQAARVIQNAWREVLANRAEKKKLKKLIKKMQDAAAAAAAAEKKSAKKK